MVMAAASAEMKAVFTSISASAPMVCIPREPCTRAPASTKRLVRITALLYGTTRVATAVPKILAASLAPSPQPR